MQIEYLDFLFEIVIFILIMHQGYYYISIYLIPMIIDQSDVTLKEKQVDEAAIKKLNDTILVRENALIKKTEQLATLEIMVNRWKIKREERSIKQLKEREISSKKFNEKIKLQLTKHAQKKNQKILLETCSINALEKIKKEKPQIYIEYTKKTVLDFCKRTKENW